ncbi:MAG: hypothetical protein ACR2HG_00870 [Pyrinomonadaceae bacterium]
MHEQEKEIFQHYEIKNWNYSPRLYKIFGAAAAFNLLAILIIGQTNLLTRKGCDSPFVNRVCQVLDAVYVGSKLLDSNSEIGSGDYQKTELADADITYIDVTGEDPPLKYPEGYFALANPNDFMAMQNPISDFSTMNPIPGIPTNPTITGDTNLINTPQVTPTPNKNAVTGTIPTSPFSFGANPVPPPIKRVKPPRVNAPRLPKTINGSPNALPNLENPTTAENKDKTNEKKTDKNLNPIDSAAVKEVEITKKPFEDLGDDLNDKLAKKEVDLTKPFLVVLDGTITADGKLDPKKSKFVKYEGDEQMVNIAKQAIEAVGESGFLSYLKNNGVDHVNFTMVQDDKQIYIKIISDQKTPEKAKTAESGFNIILAGLKFADANNFKKLDENSKALVENSKVTSDGKNFILNFALPKQDAQDIINRALKQRAEKKTNQQPNSTAQTVNANTKTGK